MWRMIVLFELNFLRGNLHKANYGYDFDNSKYKFRFSIPLYTKEVDEDNYDKKYTNEYCSVDIRIPERYCYGSSNNLQGQDY